MSENRVAFTLKVKFSFLSVFVRQEDQVLALMRDLVRPQPPNFISRNLFYPEQDHFAIFRYSPRHRFELPDNRMQKRRKRAELEDQLFTGPDLDAVRFNGEELTIHPNGLDLARAPSWGSTLSQVFPTSEIKKLPRPVRNGARSATNPPDLDCSIKDDYLQPIFAPSARTVDLAGRVVVRGGSLEVEAADLTDGQFGLYEIDDDRPIKDVPLVQGTERQVARAVTWNLEIEGVDPFVEFRFRKLNARNGLKVIQLRPAKGETRLDVAIKNCEKEEISRRELPQTYDEQLSRYELMSFYPLLNAWDPDPKLHDLPSCKLGPLENNGSGVCAPSQSP